MYGMCNIENVRNFLFQYMFITLLYNMHLDNTLGTSVRRVVLQDLSAI